MACAMFANDHHCIDSRMNHSHFIYMSFVSVSHEERPGLLMSIFVKLKHSFTSWLILRENEVSDKIQKHFYDWMSTTSADIIQINYQADALRPTPAGGLKSPL